MNDQTQHQNVTSLHKLEEECSTSQAPIHHLGKLSLSLKRISLDRRDSNTQFLSPTGDYTTKNSARGLLSSQLEIPDTPSIQNFMIPPETNLQATATTSLNQQSFQENASENRVSTDLNPMLKRVRALKFSQNMKENYENTNQSTKNSPLSDRTRNNQERDDSPFEVKKDKFSRFSKHLSLNEKNKKSAKGVSFDEAGDGDASPTSGKRWKKIKVLMQAVAKMKNTRRNSKAPDLNKKQLELLHEFSLENHKKNINGLQRQQSIQNSSQIDNSITPLPNFATRSIFLRTGIQFCSLISKLCFCLKDNRGKIMPEPTHYIKRDRPKRNIKILKVLKKPIDPSGKLKLGWDILLMTLVTIDMIILPMQISFSLFSDAAEYEYFSDVIFLLDIFITFHTAYYQNGDLNRNHRDIAKNYARSWFILDCFSTFPFHAIDDAQSSGDNVSNTKPSFLRVFRVFRILKILRALRFLKLNNIFWRFKALFGYSQAHSLFELLKLLVIVLLLSHWLACIWHLVAVCELQFTDFETWLDKRDLLDSEPSVRYINSLYWAVATMLTVGYGDITPVSVPELWTCVVAMFFACGVFAFSLNTIGTIIADISQEKAKIRFMKKKHLSKKVQQRIRGYIEHLVEEEHSRKQEQEEILSFMPENLRKDVLVDLNGEFLTEIRLFNANFRLNFLMELASQLQGRTLGPGENENEDKGDNAFYMITKGKIQLFLKKTNQALNTLTVGEHFGELAFFSKRLRTESARSLNYSHVLYLEKAKFSETLKNNEREKEAYCAIRDEVSLYNNYNSLRVQCYACDRQDHITVDCPEMHYMPSPQSIIDFVKEEDLRFKKEFVRADRRKFKALSNQAEIVEASDKFREDVLGIPAFKLSSPLSTPPRRNDQKAKLNREDSCDSSSEICSDEEKDRMHRSEHELKPELLSLIREEPIEDNSHLMILSAKSKTTKFREFSQYSDPMKGEVNKSFLNKHKLRSEIVFDRVRIFSRYFPHNNIDSIAKNLNHLNELKRISIAKKRNSSTPLHSDLKGTLKKGGSSRQLRPSSLLSLTNLF